MLGYERAWHSQAVNLSQSLCFYVTHCVYEYVCACMWTFVYVYMFVYLAVYTCELVFTLSSSLLRHISQVSRHAQTTRQELLSCSPVVLLPSALVHVSEIHSDTQKDVRDRRTVLFLRCHVSILDFSSSTFGFINVWCDIPLTSTERMTENGFRLKCQMKSCWMRDGLRQGYHGRAEL